MWYARRAEETLEDLFLILGIVAVDLDKAGSGLACRPSSTIHQFKTTRPENRTGLRTDLSWAAPGLHSNGLVDRRFRPDGLLGLENKKYLYFNFYFFFLSFVF